MKKILLFLYLSLVISHWSFATVRYVSHSGTDTPPYLTWETAADSIMSAINISSFGDTIYVANGVYEEQVVMIPGLSLIGAGMDSCIIDTKSLITSSSDISVEIADSCLLRGFQINVANNSTLGWGIAGGGSPNSLVEYNRIINAKYGIFIDATFFGIADFTVYKNICDGVNIGIEIFNSNSVIRKNIISTDPNSQAPIVAGIHLGAFDYTYKPLIDSNIMFATHAYGIRKSYGASPIVSNNTIIIDNGAAMFLSYSDTMWVYNNLIYGYGNGIHNVAVDNLLVYNNYISGVASGVVAGFNNIIKNNTITNTNIAVEKIFNQDPPAVSYNCLWNNNINYSGFTNSDTTNISVNPMVVNDDSTRGDLDFHLQMFSPLIDKGDPNILDKDGTRSDIGLYGGPFGEIYKYLDIPPRIPVNLSATIDSIYILLKWNKNTEADFSHYNLFRDTTENFTVDSTTFVASIPDTFYINIIPQGIDNLYFKLTAVDNQGNQSDPSEELHVFLTGIINNEQFTINNYQLFQNYPNPFNPSTKIGYRLKERGYVKLYVYDIKGELVETLVNKYQEGGYYEVSFNVGQDSSPDIASGVYIYQIMVRNDNNIPFFSDIKKMILLK